MCRHGARSVERAGGRVARRRRLASSPHARATGSIVDKLLCLPRAFPAFDRDLVLSFASPCRSRFQAHLSRASEGLDIGVTRVVAWHGEDSIVLHARSLFVALMHFDNANGGWDHNAAQHSRRIQHRPGRWRDHRYRHRWRDFTGLTRTSPSAVPFVWNLESPGFITSAKTDASALWVR